MYFDCFFLDALTRVFPDAAPTRTGYETDTALRGEAFAFHVAMRSDQGLKRVDLSVESPWPEATRCRPVGYVLARYPGYYFDEHNERTAPGLYPDLLRDEPWIRLHPGQWNACRVTVEVPRDAKPGRHEIAVRMRFAGATDDDPDARVDETLRFALDVSPRAMPREMPVKVTRWLYPEYIAQADGCPMWSERHWTLLTRLFGNYARHENNMAFVPLFSARRFMLAEAARDGGAWRFDFGRLERWIATARAVGVTHFEFSHLFEPIHRRQTAALPILARVDGTDRLCFDGESAEDERAYDAFLAAFLPRLEDLVDRLGLADNVFFHVSDEPSKTQLEAYRRRARALRHLRRSYPVLDALFDVEFYREGLLTAPVPAIKFLPDFIRAGVEPRWCYHFCGSWEKTPNIFLTMPLGRVRALGVVAYACRLDGFLHWGYNFWGTYDEGRPLVDVETVSDCGEWFPAGDSFVVYPGPDGPRDSLRNEALREGMQDLKLLYRIEQREGRDAAMELLREAAGFDVDSTRYPVDAASYRRLRRALHARMAAHGDR